MARAGLLAGTAVQTGYKNVLHSLILCSIIE